MAQSRRAMESASTLQMDSRSLGPLAIQAVGSSQAGSGGQGGKKINDAFADECPLGPLEPSGGWVAIAGSVVAFDSAVRDYGKKLACFSIQTVIVAEIRDIDLNLFNGQIRQVISLDAYGLCGGGDGIGESCEARNAGRGLEEVASR